MKDEIYKSDGEESLINNDESSANDSPVEDERQDDLSLRSSDETTDLNEEFADEK